MLPQDYSAYSNRVRRSPEGWSSHASDLHLQTVKEARQVWTWSLKIAEISRKQKIIYTRNRYMY